VRSTVARVIAAGLARAGARRLFATPGAARILLDAARDEELHVVDVAGATAACVMAAVTGELGEAPGAAIVSLGDGLTAAGDGAAHATRDRAPAIVLSDAVAQAGLLAPVCKASLVADAASAGHWIAHAAQLAMAAPRGAVHLAIAADVAAAPALPVSASARRAPLPPAPASVLDALADAVAGAARPVLVTGLEIVEDDAKWLRALAETLPAPVLCTPKGKGGVPDPHPLALGLLRPDHPVLALADLVIAVGVDAVEVPPRSWPALPTVHVARMPAGGEPYRPVVEVVAEIGLVVEELAPRLRERARADWDVARLDRLKRELATSAGGPGLARRRVVALVREATPAGTLAALDVPLADAWQVVMPRELLIPTGVATLGFALPAALAAALAREDRRVVAIGAAAGIHAMAAELTTAARLGVPAVVVALDPEGDTLELAHRAGLAAWSAADEAQFRGVFERAWSAGRPALVAARVVR
jgi:acetolactate synthase-1/2/3 large subunit